MLTEHEVTVEQRHIDLGIEADDGVIAAARALADRSTGATQSEMRTARKHYLATLFARFEQEIRATTFRQYQQGGRSDG